MLRTDRKACCFKGKIWLKIFLVIQISIIILIIGELATPKWVYIDSSSFEGGIIQCYGGCGKDQSYQDFYDSNCPPNSTDYNYKVSKRYCNIAEDLASAGNLKIILDVASIGAILIWLSTMLCIRTKFKVVCLSILCSFIYMIIFFASTIVWIVSAPVSFDNCDSIDKEYNEYEDDLDTFKACVSHGPKLGVALMVFGFFVAITYLIVAFKLANEYFYEEIKKKHEVRGGNTQFVIGPAQFNTNFPQPIYPQPNYLQHGPGQPAYPQPVYSQPVHPQQIYSQPMYAPTIVTQEAPPVIPNPYQNSYNPNFHDGTNLKVGNSDDTFIGLRKE